ncbi:MAG: hypothetical protein U5L09_08725 [Bacteroidales bacterium]|nr:hypothetical protein [Bacteroidales bacterium]
MSLEIQFNKKFLKDLSQIPELQRKKIELYVFQDASSFKGLEDVRGLKKLKGFKHYYRIRFGNYRAGISYKENVLTFERLLHRKDIYKYYP